MHNGSMKLVPLCLAGALALGLLTLVWALGQDSTEAQNDTMHNCPQPMKWAISVWSGDDGTDISQALATCGEGTVAVAYYIDPDTQAWLRWFAGRPEVSNLETLNDMQGVIALGPAGTLPPAATPTPTPTQETGVLPPPQEVGTISAGGNAVITVVNDTPYALTLEFQGPVTETISIARCDGCKTYSFVGPIFCPTDRPEGSVTLMPGTYTVTARVDDPSVTPFVGEWTLESDTEYGHCFYIVTTFG